MKFILASSSKNRQKLLTDLGFDFITIPPDFEEFDDPSITPEDLVKTLAFGKVQSISRNLPQKPSLRALPIVGFDSVVVFQNSVIGKPKTRQEAAENLKIFSEKWQSVITGVCLHHQDKTQQWHEMSRVKFYPLTETEINNYLDQNQWSDKCGGYSVWGPGIQLINKIEGDLYNIIGVPVFSMIKALRKTQTMV